MLASVISKADRSTRNQLASWDNDGEAPLSDRNAAEETQAALAEEEESILRCLGAAVILQWNDLHTHIQRRLFEKAAVETLTVKKGQTDHTAFPRRLGKSPLAPACRAPRPCNGVVCRSIKLARADRPGAICIL